MSDKNLHQRLLDVMRQVGYIQKKKGKMNYAAVSHDDVVAAVRGPMIEAGIVCYPVNIEQRLKEIGTDKYNNTIVLVEMQMVVVFVNADDPSDKIEVPSLGHGIDAQDKAPGKAMSYAFKYAILKTLMLETGTDPDTSEDVQQEQSAKVSKTLKGKPADLKGLVALAKKYFEDEWEHDLRLLTQARLQKRDNELYEFDSVTLTALNEKDIAALSAFLSKRIKDYGTKASYNDAQGSNDD